MKNFKRVLSLALAALMVIGGLVVAPVDAKADATYTKVTSLSELTEGTKFVIVAQKGLKIGDIISAIDNNKILSVEDFHTHVSEAKRANNRPLLLLINNNNTPHFAVVKL